MEALLLTLIAILALLALVAANQARHYKRLWQDSQQQIADMLVRRKRRTRRLDKELNAARKKLASQAATPTT